MNKNGHDQDMQADQILEDLFRFATTRPAPPEEQQHEVYESLHKQWESQVKVRKLRRRYAGFGIAATILIAGLFVFNTVRRDSMLAETTEVANIVRYSGQATLLDGSKKIALGQLTQNYMLTQKQALVTGPDSRLAIKWASGESVRIDEKSQVRFSEKDTIVLTQGRIYIDADPQQQPESKLSVKTPNGTIRHLGTQYMVSLLASGTDVRVREGHVIVAWGDAQTIARPGEQIMFSESSANTPTLIPSYGGEWSWVEQISPAVNLDDRSVFDCIQWVRRESGYQVEFGSPDAEALARSGKLRGIGRVELSPLQTLDICLSAAADLHANMDEIDQGVIWLRLRRDFDL